VKREPPIWKMSPFWLLMAILALVAALIFLGDRYRDVTVGMEIVPKVMARKATVLSAIRINMVKSVEAEKSAVMADTDEASVSFAEESLRAAEAVELNLHELAGLIERYPSGKEEEMLREFNACWAEFRRIDRQVLQFAVQNTNLKAARLSFGAGNAAMRQFEIELSRLVRDTPSGPTCKLVNDAQTAALRINVLHAPHIVSPDEEEMDGIEKVIRENDEVVRKSIDEIRPLLPAEKKAALQLAMAEYEAFMEITTRVLELSRQNTNIKSLDLSMNRKRKITAQCDEVLTSLQDAVQGDTIILAPRTLVWPALKASFSPRPVEQRFTAGAAYVDGRFCPSEDARIPLLDWGFLRSDACQETISVWDRSFFRLQDQLERFQRSIRRLRMTSPEPPDQIRNIVHALAALPGFHNADVQIIMTCGRPPLGSRDRRRDHHDGIRSLLPPLRPKLRQQLD
jgi:hypothetical protein